MSTDHHTDPMVYANPALVAVRKRVRRRRWILGGLLVVLAATVTAAFTVQLGYLTYSAGSARDAGVRIDVRDHVNFSDEGPILFLTVSEGQATPASLVQAWIDDTIDVRDEDEVRPPGGAEEDRVLNQARMNESKYVATSLALRTVGYPVKELGTGAFIDQVGASPAIGALDQGDVIVSLDDEPIAVASDLTTALSFRPVGATVSIGIRDPDGAERTESLVLAANELDPGRGFLGVVVSTADRNLDQPFEVEIDNGAVTGPSAGLAFTLGLIDRLTPESLTGGRAVAVTGTIDSEGRVGPIGGIVQKAVALKEAGATLFLYPEGQSESELRRVRAVLDGIEMRPVASLTDALAVLAPNGLPPAPPLEP